jgi:predicted SnoaL-like aldol condensation-catalyzing enzyme
MFIRSLAPVLGKAPSRCRLFIASAALLVVAASQAIAAGLPPGPAGVDLDAFNRGWEESAAKLAQSPDPKLAANKKLVVGLLYGMILSTEGRANIADVAAKYLDKNYIQHDPNIPPESDGFVRWFNAGGSVPNTPTAPKVDLKRIGLPHLVTVIAENDFVTSVSTHTWPDPLDDSKDYDVFHIGVFRIRDGRIVEHWSQSLKGAYWCRLSLCDPPAKKH